jgi:hypothetical protein
MFDMQTFWRDFQERPIMAPFLGLYMGFLDIRRYEHMPFYFYPWGKGVVSFEDRVIKFLDFMVDAHELERNNWTNTQTFYNRANYVSRNFHRYSNDTMANVMFDTKLKRPSYSKLNSVIDRDTKMFYVATTLSSMTALSFLTYVFRFRTLTKPQVVVVGSIFYAVFENWNSIMYKLMVDRPVINEARKLGLDSYVQPCGQTRPRGLNY